MEPLIACFSEPLWSFSEWEPSFMSSIIRRGLKGRQQARWNTSNRVFNSILVKKGRSSSRFSLDLRAGNRLGGFLLSPFKTKEVPLIYSTYEFLLFSMAAFRASGLYPLMTIPSTSMRGTPLEPPLLLRNSSLLLLSISILYSIKLTSRERK
jgi:hypothetical protein